MWLKKKSGLRGLLFWALGGEKEVKRLLKEKRRREEKEALEELQRVYSELFEEGRKQGLAEGKKQALKEKREKEVLDNLPEDDVRFISLTLPPSPKKKKPPGRPRSLPNSEEVEKAREYGKAYYQANREKFKRKRREYWHQNRDLLNAKRGAKRAKKKLDELRKSSPESDLR